MNIRELHARSLRDPAGYWGEAASAIDWVEPWSRVVDLDRPPFARWFVGGKLNTCYNALDRHVERGHGERIAFIHDSPLTNSVRTISYAALLDRVARFAGALRSLGVEKGDRVVLYMPMVPETAIAMLACARLGAVHSVVFGGFAAPQLAARIDDARPKVLVCASVGLEPARVVPYKAMVDEAIQLAKHPPATCVVLQRERGRAELGSRDVDFEEVLAAASPAECVAVEANDPLYILYTSGTTGRPKGIVRDNGGHAVVLMHSMEHIFQVREGETFWAASDFGWVVGHSYIVYAPLMRGCTSIIYEGKPVGTPDAGAYWRVIEEHGVVTMFVAPTAMRAIKREDPDGRLLAGRDLSRYRAHFLAGERCDPDTLEWTHKLLGVPVIDHWWQTETGSPVTAAPPGVPVRVGSAGIAMPGYDLRCLDEKGAAAPPSAVGTLALKLPLAPGALPTLYENDEGFVKSYVSDFPGYYTTFDAGWIDEDGYVFVMGRTDDIINVAGHRLSTGAIEEVLASHPAVADCAVIGVRDELKGEVPVGWIVLKQGQHVPSDVAREVTELVRARIGPVAAFKQAHVVAALPKTRSGKILRRTLRQIANGDAWEIPATTEDPAVIETLARTFGPND